MKTSESMGSVIRRLRMERGWTQEALAERISVTSQAVSKWETEQSLPDISQVPLLARTFGVTTDELFGMDNTTPPPALDGLGAYPWDPEKALAAWRQMEAAVKDGLPPHFSQEVFIWYFLYTGYRISNPESLLYCKEQAEEVLQKTLAFAEEQADRMRAPEAHDLRFSFDSLLSELLVLAGEGERALTLAGDALNNWDSLRTPWLARLYHLLGNPQLERYHLIASSAMAVEFLLDTAGDQAENYLAQKQPGLALECAETALRFISLLCGRETALPPLHDRDTGNLMQQAARACLGLGKREEALGWLLRMCDYELEVHLAGQAKSVETALFRHSIRPEPAGGDFLRFHQKLLLRHLDHPDLTPLREEPEFLSLRERVEAIAGEG